MAEYNIKAKLTSLFLIFLSLAKYSPNKNWRFFVLDWCFRHVTYLTIRQERNKENRFRGSSRLPNIRMRQRRSILDINDDGNHTKSGYFSTNVSAAYIIEYCFRSRICGSQNVVLIMLLGTLRWWLHPWWCCSNCSHVQWSPITFISEFHRKVPYLRE